MQEKQGKTLLIILAIISALLLYVRFGSAFQPDPYQSFNRIYQGNSLPITVKTSCAIPPELKTITADMIMVDKEGKVIRTISQEFPAKELQNHTLSFLVPRTTTPGGYAVSTKIHSGATVFVEETTKPFLVVDRYFPSLQGAYYPLALLISIILLLGSSIAVLKKQKKAGEYQNEIRTTPSQNFIPSKRPQQFVMR